MIQQCPNACVVRRTIKKQFDEKLKQQFANIYKFSSHNLNRFVSLQNGFYPYKCMDDQQKLIKTPLPGKEDFYSHLNMEDVTKADYTHAKRVCKDFEIKKN